MIAGLSIATAGMLDASNRLATAASRVVRTTASAFPAPAAETSPAIAVNAGVADTASLARQTPKAPPGAVLYTPSYAEDIVAMKMASAAYKANAKMLKASSNLSRELIDSLR
jgi:hypothetical protein